MSNKMRKNLDAYLVEVFNRYIAIPDKDYEEAKQIFDTVFAKVRSKMNEKCEYFKRNSKEYFYAGSVADGIKVTKLDEFDMDIVIKLPVTYKDNSDNGIVIENEKPGFVKLKITKGFDNLVNQHGWEDYNNVLHYWRDTEHYLLQNKMRDWLQSVVKKALNNLPGVEVNGQLYTVRFKHSGPAITLKIFEQDSTGQCSDSVLDVDLVPVIRFDLRDRWLQGYRRPAADQGHWYVVPKPDKSAQHNVELQNRCWRLSFQKFEQDIIKNRHHLKSTIRLVKKLRDTQKMKNIASYYIKVIFLNKMEKEMDVRYWLQKISILFREMVQELRDAIKNKNIPYYWNENHNLISGLKESHQTEYVMKLNAVLASIDGNNVDAVVESLLTADELEKFRSSEFYQRQHPFQKMMKEVVEERFTEYSEKLKIICEKIQCLSTENDFLYEELKDCQIQLIELREKKNKSENINDDDLVNLGNAIDVLEFDSQDREWYHGMLNLIPKRNWKMTLLRNIFFFGFLLQNGGEQANGPRDGLRLAEPMNTMSMTRALPAPDEGESSFQFRGRSNSEESL